MLAGKSDTLEVIELGAYKVSVAPTAKDIRRANKDIFKISKGTRKVLKEKYDDSYAFIICMFDSTKKIAPHPVGYIHDLLSSGEVFVPCVHVHDGKLHREEHFDHMIYSLGCKSPRDEETEGVNELIDTYKREERNFVEGSVKYVEYLQKTQIRKFISPEK